MWKGVSMRYLDKKRSTQRYEIWSSFSCLFRILRQKGENVAKKIDIRLWYFQLSKQQSHQLQDLITATSTLRLYSIVLGTHTHIAAYILCIRYTVYMRYGARPAREQSSERLCHSPCVYCEYACLILFCYFVELRTDRSPSRISLFLWQMEKRHWCPNRELIFA